MSDEHDITSVGMQAMHDGEWVNADEWFFIGINGTDEEQEAMADIVKSLLDTDDYDILRELPDQQIDCVQRLALLAWHELAFRYEEKTNQGE